MRCFFLFVFFCFFFFLLLLYFYINLLQLETNDKQYILAVHLPFDLITLNLLLVCET